MSIRMYKANCRGDGAAFKMEGGLSSEFARLRRAAADLLARKDFE